MDMDNDDSKHETQIDRAEMSDRHETSDGTAPGSGPGLRGGATPLCLHWFRMARMERL
jgi:hypothetical protein